MNNGPVISSSVGRLMACTTPQKWPLLSPRSRYHLPPGQASSFIGMGLSSAVSLNGPSCSNSAANVASSGARTWISSVKRPDRLRVGSIEHPAAVAPHVDQAHLEQHSEVLRHRRLRHPQRIHNLP